VNPFTDNHPSVRDNVGVIKETTEGDVNEDKVERLLRDLTREVCGKPSEPTAEAYKEVGDRREGFYRDVRSLIRVYKPEEK
jgi:hypothetical protein